MPTFKSHRTAVSEQAVGLTIDDLAAKTGVPSRTIRFYQAKGALPRPIKRGRVAYYDDRHVERLKMVAQLQERGLNLRAIRDLIRQIESGTISLNQWLGVEKKLEASWVEDESLLLSEEQICARFGHCFGPDMIAELERGGFISRDPSQGPGAYQVPSAGMLQIASQLQAGGFDVRTTKAVADLMRKRLAKLADELVEYFYRYLRKGIEQKRFEPDQLERSVETLRTIWLDATRLVLAHQIERAIRDRIEKGEL